MRKPKVLIDFSRYTDAELDQVAATIIAAMTDNTNFTTPVPALSLLSTALTAYRNALSAAAMGGEADTIFKDQQREALEELLVPLGLYVELESNGDEAVMLSSGYKVSKQPTPVGQLPKPSNFKVRATG